MPTSRTDPVPPTLSHDVQPEGQLHSRNSANNKARMSQPSRKAATPATARKRSETSDDGDERAGKKRSRGRPRLDTKDETAADRRRTQIRLAQRAYRNRKDTAIDTLKQKVKELEQVNENMGKEFMSFSGFVLQQGLDGSPEVARRLNDATRKFLSLTRKGAEDASTDAGTDAEADADPGGNFNLGVEQHGRQRGAKNNSSTSTSSSEVHSTPNTDWSTEDAGLHSVQELSEPFQQFSPLIQMPINSITQPSVKDASFPVLNTRAQVSLFTNPFAQPPYLDLPAPSSLASQERSFGRRLQRATVEAGLRLASMQNPPPERYMAVFSFCLQFENRQEIIRRLSVVLDSTTQETLNNWKYPFTNLGGAGMFFPGYEGNGRIPEQGPMGSELPIGNQGLPEPYRPSEMTGFSMGPFGREIEFTRDMRVDHRMRMLHPGFEGDFFDADEVETYLRQRGIVIPANKDFVDAEIDLAAFENPPDTGLGLVGCDRQGFFGRPMPIIVPQNYLPPYSNNVDAAGNMWPGQFSPSTNPLPALDSHMGSLASDIPTMGSAHQFSQSVPSFEETPDLHWRAWETETTSNWTKTKVTLDVNRLVTELTGMAVCLGRSPGVRPKDLHKAVRMSIVLQGNLT